MEKNSNLQQEVQESQNNATGVSGCGGAAEDKKQTNSCCFSRSPSNKERDRSASKMIVSLSCFVASLYFYMVPSFFTATISDFLRGVLTATFIFAGLIVFGSKSGETSDETGTSQDGAGKQGQ